MKRVRELTNKLSTFKLKTDLEDTGELYSHTCRFSTEPEGQQSLAEQQTPAAGLPQSMRSLKSSTPTPGPR